MTESDLDDMLDVYRQLMLASDPEDRGRMMGLLAAQVPALVHELRALKSRLGFRVSVGVSPHA